MARVVTVVAMLVFGMGLSAQAADEPVALMGYGTVRVSFTRDGAVFQCQDPEHADILLDKLRADLTWDAQAGVSQIRLANGAPAYQHDVAGVLVVARLGKEVRCLAGASPEAVAALMRQARIDPATAAYVAAKPRPASLDYCDLQAVRISTPQLLPNAMERGGEALSAEAMARVLEPWSKLGIGMGANLRTYLGADNRLDGPPHTFPTEHAIRLARQAGMSVNVWFGPVLVPWWLRSRFPDQMDRSEGIWAWIKDPSAMGNAYPGMYMDDALRAYIDRYDLDVLHAVRQAAGDGLASIRIATGRPGDESSFHGFSTELMDRSPADAQGFRAWLGGKRKLDLPALGVRWHGDAKHFRAWSEVQPPSMFEFYGGYGQGTCDLGQDWRWRPDRGDDDSAEAWTSDAYQPGAEWTPLDLFPSKQQLVLISATKERGDAPEAWCFRKRFDATDWLTRRPGKTVHLVIGQYSFRDQPAQVYLNGVDLGRVAPRRPTWVGPASIDITARLRAGPNLLCIRLAKDPLLRGPVFLTAQEPRAYPYLGKEGNARWIDLRDWQVDKMIDGYARIAAPVLREVPDIPIQFVSGSEWRIADRLLELKRSSGFTTFHDTGSECSYRPLLPGLGYAIGAYASSEESALTKEPERLSAELGWFLLDAVSEHNYVPQANQYLPVEQETGWFAKNRRLLQLLGKAAWVRPSIALLRSGRNESYFPRSSQFHGADLGQGIPNGLRAIHHGNVYVTEAEVLAGVVGDYPVLIDCDSLVLDQDTLAALRRYVEGGGTFIATVGSGRHGLLEPDTWPIAQLTGFTVAKEQANAPLTILPGNPLLAGFAGRDFTGGGLGLKPADAQATAIATWKDGSVVIGQRKLGKGRVIILGSDFWRQGAVQAGFLAELLDALGAKAEVACDAPQVWTSRQVTKNGLQEWVVAFNAEPNRSQSGVRLSFAVPAKPARLFNVASGAEVPFTYADGRVTVADLDFEPSQVVVLGLARGRFAEALPLWFAEKTTYWRRVDAQPKTTALPRPPYSAIVFDKLRFRPGDAAALTASAWRQEPATGGAWKDAGFGFWDDLGFPGRGIGLYRATFTLPADAERRRWNLGLISHDTPVFFGKATVYVNGTKILDYQQHYWSNFETGEVSGLLRAGANELAVVVQASAGRGGYGGQLALYPLETLREPQALTDWQLFQDNTASDPVATPIADTGYFVRTEPAIPAGWAGKPIWLEFTSSTVGPALVMLNGQPITLNCHHPVGGVFQVNLTPWAKPGQPNRLEIWCSGSWPWENQPVNKTRITLDKVSIGLVGPG